MEVHDWPMVSSKAESRNLTPLGIPKPKQAGTSQLEPRSTLTRRSRPTAHGQGLQSVSFLPPSPTPTSEAPPRPPQHLCSQSSPSMSWGHLGKSGSGLGVTQAGVLALLMPQLSRQAP